LQVSIVVSEAANFAIPVWLDVASQGKQSLAWRAAMNCLPILSHHELLYLLAMSIASQAFSLFYRELFLVWCMSGNSGRSLLLNHIYISHWSLTPHPTCDFWTLATTVPDS
jgi:hypothetical protein